jgi:transketolase
LGISHHATEDLAIMRSLPDLTVVSPCGLWETAEATKAIIAMPGTCFLRLDKSSGSDAPQDSTEEYRLGQARILRKGSDVSIIVTGGILEEVQQASDILESKGISVQIISMHTLKPLDKETIIQAAKNTDAVVTVEEHTIHGGLGGAVAETLMDHAVYPKRFLRIGLKAGFSSIVGSQNYLRKQYGLDAKAITEKIQSLMTG